MINTTDAVIDAKNVFSATQKQVVNRLQTPGLDILMNQRVSAIQENIKTAEKLLPTTMRNESFTIAEMRERYLPETISAYLQAKEKQPKEAEKLFNEQIDILEQGVDTTLEAIADNNLDKLKQNGYFLQERFGKVQN